MDAGIFGVYAGTTKDELQEVVDLILQELRGIQAGKIREEDLSAAKEYLRGHIILSLEGTDGRMSRLAKDEICFGRHIPLEEILGELAGVCQDAIAEVVHEMLDSHPLCLTLLGPLTEGELPWKTLDL
jgi:predicted Zn-dependent peptidase